MTKITIPVTAAQNGGALYTLVDDLTNTNSEVIKYPDGANLIIEFPANARPENKFKGDQSVILAVLAEGGEIEDYLFGIKGPISAANVQVPVGVPLRLNILQEARVFKDWLDNNADAWKNTTDSEIIFYNNPSPSRSIILKASEAELIRQINTANYSFLTIDEVQTEVAGPNWVKLP